eukprot:COSAG06_NODE_910_length_11598_cov_583.165580_10_plen_1373_part_01
MQEKLESLANRFVDYNITEHMPKCEAAEIELPEADDENWDESHSSSWYTETPTVTPTVLDDKSCQSYFENQIVVKISNGFDPQDTVESSEMYCPDGCAFVDDDYTAENFTDINAGEDSEADDWIGDLSGITIWGEDGPVSHSICDCNPAQDTRAEKAHFLNCMHAFYLKNLGVVILVIVCVITAEICLGIFGWKVLRPWAMRRLAKITNKSPNHRSRSNHWEVVAAFALPETEEDIVRKETAIVTETWYFEGTVIGCVSMAMYVLAKQSPTVPPPEDEVLFLRIIEVFVTVFLTMELFLEMTVTISTRRFKTYVMNLWHWVDYLVLVVSWLYLLDTNNKFTAVCRALRVVRPMRSVRIFSSIKLIGDSLKADSGVFVDVTAFTLLLILTFSLVGLTMFHGSLQYTCGVPQNLICPGELNGVCPPEGNALANETDAGAPLEVRTSEEGQVWVWAPREAYMPDQKSSVEVQERLIEEEILQQVTWGGAELVVGERLVALPSAEELDLVYGEDHDKSPHDGLPCPQTLQCGKPWSDNSPSTLPWWQKFQDPYEQPEPRCYLLDPPRVLNEDESGNRGFDDMAQGFITFLVSMSGDGGMEEVPTGLVGGGAATSYLAWPFFFVASILLNFVTLNLLLAMCVSALENVNEEFTKRDKDKKKAKKLQAKAMAKKKARERAEMAALTNIPDELGFIPGVNQLNKLTSGMVTDADKLIDGGLDKLVEFEGFDFDEERTELERKVHELHWEGTFGPLRNECKLFVMSHYYRNAVTLMILLWTLTLMFNTGIYETDDRQDNLALEQLFQQIELAIVIGLVAEIVLKVAGVGVALFIRSQESILDLLFLILTCLAFSSTHFGFVLEFKCESEFLMERAVGFAGNDTGTSDTDTSDLEAELAQDRWVQDCITKTISVETLQIFTMLRVVQIMRMLYKHDSIFTVMQTIFKNWKAIIGILTFVVFSMAMFSIVGMHLLGSGQGFATAFPDSGLCCTDDDGELYFRSNFETFWDAMLSVVQIILGDDWALIMLWYMNNAGIEGYAAIFFTFAFLWVFGVLFNLFVAVLLINFGVDEDDKIPKQKENYHREQERLERDRKSAARKAGGKQQHHEHSEFLAKALKADANQEELTTTKNKQTAAAINRGDIDLVHALEVDLNPLHKSLFLFRSNSHFRLRAARIEVHPWFMNTFIGLVFISMVVLALENEKRTDCPALQEEYKTCAEDSEEACEAEKEDWENCLLWGDFVWYMERSVLFMFAAEAALKTISSGFMFKCGPSTPYLGSQRGRNDFLYLVTATALYLDSVQEHMFEEYSLENRHVRLIRGLGPMAGLLQSPGIRTVMKSFYSCLAPLISVMFPMVFVLIMFALLGYELYAGLLLRCECPPPN